MAEVRLRPPRPEGENDVREIKKRPVPSNYTAISYVVHPSAIDGDRNHVAQAAIQQHLDIATPQTRVVLIAPPQEYTYLAADTVVTDTRANAQYYHWVRDGDITGDVTSVTLVGGNLERCLGAVAQDVIRQASENNDRQVEIKLPLDSIYTTDQITAQDALSYLLQHSEQPLEAIAALLTTNSPHTISYGYDMGEFEIISKHGEYVVELNGKRIGELKQPVEEIIAAPPIPEGTDANWVLGMSRIPPIIPPRAIIQLFMKQQETTVLDLRLQEKFQSKILYARETVLPGFKVTI